MTLAVIDDSTVQLERNLQVVLSNPSFGVIGGDSLATVTITDDESEHLPC